MDILRDSHLEEYARQFWLREKTSGKGYRNDSTGYTNRDAFNAMDLGGDGLLWLRNVHPYKLPSTAFHHDSDGTTRVVALSRTEVSSLVIHDYMLDSKWFKDARLIPEPPTTRLETLAQVALSRGYFDLPRADTQISCWRKWRDAGSLDAAIEEESMPLIELNSSGLFEIIDGWGRLLPYEALLQRGFAFHAPPVFLFSKP